MNRKTEKAKLKKERDRNATTCKTCNQHFMSRKQRHDHELLVHRPEKPTSKIRPAAELYGE